MGKLTYEECRLKRLEENKKRMDALHLPHLSLALQKSHKSSSMKQAKSRTDQTQMAAVRRSRRVANQTAPVYVEVAVEGLCEGRTSNVARVHAIERAEKVQSGLAPGFPSFVKSMLQSHASGGFWLDLPPRFCKDSLPRCDEVMTLVDEEGDEYPTVYLARNTRLSSGWKGFAVSHDLVDGDALVFELIRPTKFKAKAELDYNPRSLKDGLAKVPLAEELGINQLPEGIESMLRIIDATARTSSNLLLGHRVVMQIKNLSVYQSHF